MKNLKPRRHQEERGNSIGFRGYLPKQNAASANGEDDKNEMGPLYLEMEDWYRGAERHGMVQAV